MYNSSPSFSYALTDASSGRNAGYSIINNASAPKSYQYSVTVDGAPAKLTLNANDSVIVKNEAGKTINVIAPAWAKDANGTAVATKYSVSNGVLTQSVKHQGAAYPVVADPQVQCDFWNCTVEFTRSETKTAADGAGGFALICGAGAAAWVPLGIACGVLAGSSMIVANQAKNQGDCLGLRAPQILKITPGDIYPVIVPCYA